MVMPLLYGLGAKDFHERLGYVIIPCQKCGTSGPFSVFHAQRKVTFFGAPTVAINEQMVVECRACTQRFGVPTEMQPEFRANLLNEQQVVQRMRSMNLGAPGTAAASGPTYYQALQVDVAADPEVIEAAFRRLALKYHPDKTADPEAPEKMRRILEAKEVLSDPAKRRLYDRTLGIAPRSQAMRADEV
jgi:hypothetical protein